MTFDLGRRLLLTNAVTVGELRHAVFEAVARGKPFARALADASPAARTSLVRPAADRPAPQAIVPLRDAMDALPSGLAERLLVVPVRRDGRAGTLDVAVIDATDPHVVAEVAYHTGATVRAYAAPLDVIERALEAHRSARRSLEPPAPALLALDVAPSEDAMPLVRRGRSSLSPPAPPAAVVAPDRPSHRASDRPSAAVPLILDFSAATREEHAQPPSTRRGTPPEPARRPIAVPRAPYAPIEPALAAMEQATDRDAILEALLGGLLTTAGAAALLVHRRGQFVAVRGGGDLDTRRLQSRAVPATGAVAETLRRGERLGHLDGLADAELLDVFDLRFLGAIDVLMHVVVIGERAAMILVSFAIADLAEAARRTRSLAHGGGAALTRLLRG